MRSYLIKRASSHIAGEGWGNQEKVPFLIKDSSHLVCRLLSCFFSWKKWKMMTFGAFLFTCLLSVKQVATLTLSFTSHIFLEVKQHTLSYQIKVTQVVRVLQQNSILRWTAWDRRSQFCEPVKEPVIIHEMDASNDDSSNSDVLMCDEFRRGKIVDATP